MVKEMEESIFEFCPFQLGQLVNPSLVFKVLLACVLLIEEFPKVHVSF